MRTPRSPGRFLSYAIQLRCLARRLRARPPRAPRPESISQAVAGRGTGVAVPEIATLSKRQLPELLFKAVPCVLTSSAPVDALTSLMAKFGSFAAFGLVIVAVRSVNQSWPAFDPLFKRLSLTYDPVTVLVSEPLL